MKGFIQRPKLGSVVRLTQGDTDTLYLVTEYDVDKKLIWVRAVDELDCIAWVAPIGIFRKVELADHLHDKIIKEWLDTKSGRALAVALTK